MKGELVNPSDRSFLRELAEAIIFNKKTITILLYRWSTTGYSKKKRCWNEPAPLPNIV